MAAASSIDTPPAMRGATSYLLEEEAAAEALAGRVRIATVGLLVAVQVPLILLGQESFVVAATAGVALAVATFYGLLLRRLLEQGYRPWMSFASIVHDCLLVLALLLAISAVSGGGVFYARTAKQPFSLLFFPIVVLAALRQLPRLALFAGIFGGACYLALLVPVLLATPQMVVLSVDVDFTTAAVSTVRMGTIAVLIAISGLVAGFVAGRTRRLVQRAVTERESAVREQQRRETLLSAFERYFPEKEALALISEGRALEVAGERRLVTVLTADIRGFTSISEPLEPDAVVELLNRHFGAMVEIVFDHEGTLISYVGDALWAVFGLPRERPDDAARAVAAGRAMLRRVDEMNARREFAEAGPEGLRIGIAIHTGEVIAGSVGSERRVEYTVIGDTVNTTSRLEELNKELGTAMLVSEATAARLDGRDGLTDAGSVEIRGRQAPLRIYRPA